MIKTKRKNRANININNRTNVNRETIFFCLTNKKQTKNIAKNDIHLMNEKSKEKEMGKLFFTNELMMCQCKCVRFKMKRFSIESHAVRTQRGR